MIFKLDDEAMRVAVGLRLGMDLCQPHQWRCGSLMDARGLHSFVCKRALGRTARHHAPNDLITRSFAFARVPVTKEPVGLFRTDRKRLDGLTLIPWQSGNSSCWDITITCPLAELNIKGTTREAGSTAEMVASCKEEKYIAIEPRHIFQPIEMEKLGIFSFSARQLLSSLGHRISTSSENLDVVAALNAVPLHDCLPALDCVDWVSYLFVSFFSNFFFSNPSGTYLPRVYKIIIISLKGAN